jgi:hypothetical protein
LLLQDHVAAKHVRQTNFRPGGQRAAEAARDPKQGNDPARPNDRTEGALE